MDKDAWRGVLFGATSDGTRVWGKHDELALHLHRIRDGFHMRETKLVTVLRPLATRVHARMAALLVTAYGAAELIEAVYS